MPVSWRETVGASERENLHPAPKFEKSCIVYGTQRWSTGRHEISVRLDMFGPAPRPAYHNFLLGMVNEKDPKLTGGYLNLAWSSYDDSSGALGQPWCSGDVIHNMNYITIMSLDCEYHTLVARHEATGAVVMKTNVTGEIRLYLVTYCPLDQATIR